MTLSENGQKVYDRVKLVLNKAKAYGGNANDTSVGVENYLFVVRADNTILVHNLPLQQDLEATGLIENDFNTCLAGLEDKGLLVKENLSPVADSPLWYHKLPDDQLFADAPVVNENNRQNNTEKETGSGEDL